MAEQMGELVADVLGMLKPGTEEELLEVALMLKLLEADMTKAKAKGLAGQSRYLWIIQIFHRIENRKLTKITLSVFYSK